MPPPKKKYPEKLLRRINKPSGPSYGGILSRRSRGEIFIYQAAEREGLSIRWFWNSWSKVNLVSNFKVQKNLGRLKEHRSQGCPESKTLEGCYQPKTRQWRNVKPPPVLHLPSFLVSQTDPKQWKGKVHFGKFKIQSDISGWQHRRKKGSFTN